MTFDTNVQVPAPLLYMTGRHASNRYNTWAIEFTSARPLLSGVQKASAKNFLLQKSGNHARISLVERIPGPQDVVVKVSMNVTSYVTGYVGVTESLLYLYVTDQHTL